MEKSASSVYGDIDEIAVHTAKHMAIKEKCCCELCAPYTNLYCIYKQCVIIIHFIFLVV